VRYIDLDTKIPNLSLKRSEPLPMLKASVRYLRHVLSAATDVPEFQRQLATPTVPKFSQALVSIVENVAEYELKVGD
jgi:hypothetical protein